MLLQQHINCLSRRPASLSAIQPIRLRVTVISRANRQHDSFSKHRYPLHEGLPLSLFHPYRRLPPDGKTAPSDEELCDPEEQACKTPLHVYEAQCTVCNGTGFARSPSNGRRGQLGTCLLCHGLGYVRRTTSRFHPDDGSQEGRYTIARPLTHDSKLAARRSPQSSDGRSPPLGSSTSGMAGSRHSAADSSVGSDNGSSSSKQ